MLISQETWLKALQWNKEGRKVLQKTKINNKNFLHYKEQCVTINKQSEISVFSSKAWQCLSKVNSMAVSVTIRMMFCGDAGI